MAVPQVWRGVELDGGEGLGSVLVETPGGGWIALMRGLTKGIGSKWGRPEP